MEAIDAKGISNSQNRRVVTGLARELFIRYGFLRITMDDIASGAGISKKTLYRYFESKDQLVNTCIAQEINQIYVHLAIILSCNIRYAEKWDHCIRLITRRSQETESVFYRDILSRPGQIQLFNKKKSQIIDLILNSFVNHNDRAQPGLILDSFLTLLLLSVSGQPDGIDRKVFRQTVVPFYGQAYDFFEKSSGGKRSPQRSKFVKAK